MEHKFFSPGWILVWSTLCPTNTFAQTPPVIVQERCIGGSDIDELRRMHVLANGDLAAIGSSASNDGDVPDNFGELDAWMFIYDILFNPHDSDVFGGPATEKGVDLVETTAGDIVVLANTTGAEYGCTGGANIALIKTTSSGTVTDFTCLSGSLFDEGVRVVEDTLLSHLFVVANIRSTDGSFASYAHHGQTDIGLFEYDQNLDLLNGVLIGSSGIDLVKDAILIGTDLWLFGETSGADGDLAGTTPFGSDDLVAMAWSLDSWSLTATHRYGGTDTEHIERATRRPGGGFALFGNTWSDAFFNCTDNSSNAFHMGIAADGTVDWTGCRQGSGTESWTSAIYSPAAGAHFAVGYSTSTDGDFIGGDVNFEAVIAAFNDGDGATIWQFLFGGTGGDLGRDILQLPDGDLLALNSTSSTDGDVQSTNHGNSDAWLVQFEHYTGLTERTTPGMVLEITPVPTSDRIWVQLPPGTQQVELYDAQGRRLATDAALPGRASHAIDLSGRPAGVYMVRTCGKAQAGHGRCLKL